MSCSLEPGLCIGVLFWLKAIVGVDGPPFLHCLTGRPTGAAAQLLVPVRVVEELVLAFPPGALHDPECSSYA